MRKSIAYFLCAILVFATVCAFSGIALADQRDYTLSNLQVGGARFSSGYIYKHATDMQAYCVADSIGSGQTFICRLYLTDKSTKAMNNPMTVSSSNTSATGAITYGAGTGYYVYMSFKNTGDRVVNSSGYWGTRN